MLIKLVINLIVSSNFDTIIIIIITLDESAGFFFTITHEQNIKIIWSQTH